MTKYFDKILPKHKGHYFKPVHRKVGIKKHYQLPLFSSVKNKNHHVKMGIFYELLTSALFGGALIDRVIQIDNEHLYVGCKPDVKNRITEVIYESKGVKQGSHLNLLTDQINRYKALQIINSKYDIYFTIWRHKINKVIAKSRTDREFRKELSDATLVGIKVPLSFIYNIHQKASEEIEEYNKHFRKYDTPSWDCVSVQSPFLNGLILNPKQTINTIADAKEYTWERFMIPSGIIVDNIEVKPFPLIVIKDKNRNWVKSLIEEVPF